MYKRQLFTGAVAEVTVDTDKNTVVVHDGSDIGGFELQRARWEVVSSNGNLTCGLRWLVDTTSSAISLLMPFESAGVVPHIGDMLELVDFKGTWAINNVTLTTNGGQQILNKFGNTDSEIILDVPGLYVQIISEGSYWRILA